MYQRPSWAQRRVVNPIMKLLTGQLGRDMDGIWVLEVCGRVTGTWVSMPVKPVQVEDRWHLVSLLGDSDWARNLRQTPRARLRLGRQTKLVEAEELPPAERVPALREYLRRASRQATRDILADGQGTTSDDHLRGIAADHPVFRLHESVW